MGRDGYIKSKLVCRKDGTPSCNEGGYIEVEARRSRNCRGQ